MLTIAIPQLYCGASGHKGSYNRQSIGLARAFAALGCRAIAVYLDPAAAAPQKEILEPGVEELVLPAWHLGSHGFAKSWQPLVDEGVQAVHALGDNQLGLPGLYCFCRARGLFIYTQAGVLKSASDHAAVRLVMDLLCRRNLAVYKKIPTYAKNPAVAAELERLGVPCAGVMTVGLDTAIIPAVSSSRAEVRQALAMEPGARYLVFVGRLDAYKRPLDLVPLLEALPDWQAIVIGQGALGGELERRLAEKAPGRVRHIPRLPNTEVHAYYHACDVFVNLNDQEIFGMSLLEAMYAGCPPVARHAPGPDYIIEDGVSGLLGDSIQELAAACRRAAADPAMGAAAQRRVNEHFLWHNSAKTALALWEEHRNGQR